MEAAVVEIDTSAFSTGASYSVDVGQNYPSVPSAACYRAVSARPERVRIDEASDDAVMVSDGDTSWTDGAIANLVRQLRKRYRSTEAHSTVASPLLQFLASQDSSLQRGSISGWQKYYEAIALGQRHAKETSFLVDVALAAERWHTASLSLDLQFAQQSYHKFQQKRAISNYNILLSELLTEHNFSHEPPYEDILGSQTIDFVREADRITIVLRDNIVQVMAYLDNEFSTQTFEGMEGSKPRVLEYIIELFS